MEQAAQRVYTILDEEVSHGLLAVGYFSDKEKALLYENEFLNEEYTEAEIVEVLESALLTSIGDEVHEEMHSSELRATTRVFDEVIDTAIAVGDGIGVVFALDRNAEYDYREIVDRIEAELSDELVGVTVPA